MGTSQIQVEKKPKKKKKVIIIDSNSVVKLGANNTYSGGATFPIQDHS